MELPLGNIEGKKNLAAIPTEEQAAKDRARLTPTQLHTKMMKPKTHSPADWDKLVAESCDHYNLTGEIHDILLTGFNQKGHWVGLKSRINGSDFPPQLTKNLKREVIPTSRLVTKTASGETTLWGSYHSSSKSPVNMPFQHVAGWIRAKNASAFSAPHLYSVGWDMELGSAKRLVIPQLARVGGGLAACSARTFVAETLQFVGGCLCSCRAKQLLAPMLRQVDGPLQAGSAAKIDLSSLLGVMDKMNCDSAEELNLPELRQVTGFLHADSARLVVAPELLHAGFLSANAATSVIVPKLIADALEIAVSNAREFIKIDTMGGKTLHASIYDDSAEYVYLDFVHVKGNIEVQDQAKSFDAPNLKSVGGYLSAASAQEFAAPRLRRVGGDLDTSSARGFWKTDLCCGSWSPHPDARKVWLAEYARNLLRQDSNILEL